MATATKKKTPTKEQSGNPAKRAKPQDHKPKKSANLTTTIRGIEVSVDPDALDDWELIEVVSALDSGDNSAMLALPAVVRRLLGNATYEQVKNACRDENGRVSAEAMGEFVGELFVELAPNS